MKKVLMVAVMTAMAGGAYAAEWSGATQFSDQFSGVQTIKASEINAESSSVVLPDAPVKAVAGELNDDGGLSKMSGLCGSTQFEKLKSLFNEGVPATKEDLTGWYSGRRVYDTDPDLIYGALLIGKDEPVAPITNGGPLLNDGPQSDGGPLLGGCRLFNVLIRQDDPAHANSFDNMSVGLIEAMKRDKPDGSLTFPAAAGDVKANSLTGKAHMEYRMARGYIVEYSSDQRGYAYYFLNVTP